MILFFFFLIFPHIAFLPYHLCCWCPKWEVRLLLANKAFLSHLCERCYVCEDRHSWFFRLFCLMLKFRKHMFKTHLKDYKVLKAPRFIVLTSSWNQQSTPKGTRKKEGVTFTSLQMLLGKEWNESINLQKIPQWIIYDILNLCCSKTHNACN